MTNAFAVFSSTAKSIEIFRHFKKNSLSNLRKSKSLQLPLIQFSQFSNISGVKVFISLIIAFPFSTILSISNPINEFIRISESQNIPRWPTQTLNKNIESVLTAKDYAEDNNGKLVYFGYLGNYLSLKTGVQSGILFNNPKEILVGGLENREDISCSYLKEINPEYIVIDDLFDGFSSGNNTPYSLIDIGETGLCGEYFIFEINKLQDGYFLKKLQNES